jgi:hypothetical protein
MQSEHVLNRLTKLDYLDLAISDKDGRGMPLNCVAPTSEYIESWRRWPG